MRQKAGKIALLLISFIKPCSEFWLIAFRAGVNSDRGWSERLPGSIMQSMHCVPNVSLHLFICSETNSLILLQTVFHPSSPILRATALLRECLPVPRPNLTDDEVEDAVSVHSQM